MARDNVRSEIAQVCNVLTHFPESVSLDRPALLNIFDSTIGQGNGTQSPNTLLLVTR